MRHLQVKRPRISTMVLAALFLATFALYLLVRPVPVPAATVQPAQIPTSTPSPTAPASSPSPTATHSSPHPSRTPSRTPQPSSSVTPSATLSPLVTPSASASFGSGAPLPSSSSSLSP
jgi:hypothetical protein